MYSNKLVACVKSNGHVLREKGENVYLPFGSEYTLWFKNEHTRKVQISVSIDGTDVLFGKSLIISPDDTADLKGFIRDMNGHDNRAFKFITKTKAISDFRGDKIEDGLIKVTYQFENEIKPFILPNHIMKTNNTNSTWQNYHTYTPWNNPTPDVYTSNSNNIRNDSIGNNDITFDTYSSKDILATTQYNDVAPLSKGITRGMSFDPGITVEGSNTGQSFNSGYINSLELKIHSMIFQLKGFDANEEVTKPITVKTKKQCPTCGKNWPSDFEYCPIDTTFLRVP